METLNGTDALGNPMRVVGPFSRHRISYDIREDHYPAVPATIRHLVDAEDKLEALELELTAPPSETYHSYIEQVMVGLTAGEDLPSDFAVETRRLVEVEEHRGTALLAVQQLMQDLGRRWEITLREHIDELLDGLRDQLTGLLAEIRVEGAHLDGLDLTNAEAIADATPRQRKAIGALRDLRACYNRIRHLQRDLVETVVAEPWKADGYAVRSTWGSVWKLRVHEFSDVLTHGIPAQAATDLHWFAPLVQRDDVWLPSMSDLRDAWLAVRP